MASVWGCQLLSALSVKAVSFEGVPLGYDIFPLETLDYQNGMHMKNWIAFHELGN